MQTAATEDSLAVTSPTSPYSLRQTRHLSWKMIDQEISSTTTETPQQQQGAISPVKPPSPKPEKKVKPLLTPTIDLPRDISVGHLLSPKAEQPIIVVQSPPDNLLRKSLRSFRLSQSSNGDEQPSETVSSSAICKTVESESDSAVSPVVEYCSRLRSRNVKSPSMSPVNQPSTKQAVTSKETLTTVTTEEPVTIVTTKEPVATILAEEPVTIVTTEDTVTTDKPVTMVTTDKSVSMITTDKPVAMVTTEKPVTMVTTEKPVTTVTSEKSINMITSEKPVAMVTSEEPIVIASEPVKDEPVSSCNNEMMVTPVTDEVSHSMSKDSGEEEEEVEVIIVEAAEQLTVIPSPSEPVIMMTIDDQEDDTTDEGDGQPVIVESFDDDQVVTNDVSMPSVLPVGDDNICTPAIVKEEEIEPKEFRKRLRSHSSSDSSDHSVKKMKSTAQNDVNGISETVSERSVTMLYSLLS